jgi:hypothetical protein
MEFFEKDLEEIIYTTPNMTLCERGLYLPKKLIRQLRIGNYGIADLVGYRRPFYHPDYSTVLKGEINVIELKNKKIGVSTFFQALNYLHGIKRFLAKKGIEDHYNYTITLIGREFDKNSSFAYLGETFNTYIHDTPLNEDTKTSIKSLTYSFDIEGMLFNELSGYSLNNEGF